MQPKVDYHLHTPLCGHATGTPAEYAQAALDAGLAEIGFSDHAPLVSHRNPDVTMDFDELPQYHKMIEDVVEQFAGRLKIKVGIEADYVKGYEAQTKKMLESYAYDYVIGSVHIIDSWAFDDPKDIKGWDERNTDAVYKDYYEHLRMCASCGLFDIMAHVDLVKKFGHRPARAMHEEIHKTADCFAEVGVVIEVNSSGLRKPVKEIFPSLDCLKIYCEHEVPIVFGSDSHAPEQVGMDFDKARELAFAAGYKEHAIFLNRSIIKMMPIV